MARKTKRAKLNLTGEQRNKLELLRNSRKAPLRKTQRTQILLHYADEGMGSVNSRLKSILTIAKQSAILFM